MVRHFAVKGAPVLAAALLCCGASAQVAAPELLKPENRTFSDSRQFTIFGGTRSQRSDLARRAESLKSALLRELAESDNWKAPILVVLTPGDGVRLRQAPVLIQVFDAEEAGRKIQVDLAPGTLVDRTAVDRGLMRALLLERSLRAQKFEGGRFVEPPDWLSSALAGSLGRDASGDAALYSSLLEARSMPRLDRFLRQNGQTLQGRARDLHAAQSVALYRGLLDLPDGRRRILSNLSLAEPARDPLQRFAQTWPGLADDEEKVARLWALSVARLSTPAKLESLSAEETGKKLRYILRDLDSSAGGEPSSEALLALSRRDDGRFRLSQASIEARRLGFRTHPLYAPVVQEYCELLGELSAKRRRGFEKRFLEAEDLRAELGARSKEIADYMNWYQANEGSEQEDVAAVLRPAERASETPRRNDGITRYLDSVEERGW